MTKQPEPLLEVGRISKAHGLRGEVVVHLVSDRLERVAPGSVLFSDGKSLVVETSRPHQGNFLVVFAGCASRDAAEELRGLVLSAPPIDDPAAMWAHDLIGRTVVDTKGETLGTVTALEVNPASDLLVLDNDGLVPMTFFVEMSGESIVVDPPVGLLEPHDAD